MSLIGEHCPGTVRLFCEGVDLTQLEWRLYYGDNYSSKTFVSDSVNGTKQVFNDSSLVSASVELVQVSQDRISKLFANFSSINSYISFLKWPLRYIISRGSAVVMQ